MANFYTDNEDIQFHFDHMDVARLAGVMEDGFVFAAQGTVQSFLAIGDRVSEIAILGTDYRDVSDLERAVAEAAGADVEVRPWRELEAYLASMVDVMDGFILVWIIVIFMALSFGLVNTLVMAVFERVREIGLMLALGMKPSIILGQIIVESVLLLLIGLLIGNLLAWATVAPLADGIDVSMVAEGMEMFGSSSVLYPELALNDVVMANAIVILLGIVASLSPAWRASRYQPIEAITKV